MLTRKLLTLWTKIIRTETAKVHLVQATGQPVQILNTSKISKTQTLLDQIHLTMKRLLIQTLQYSILPLHQVRIHNQLTIPWQFTKAPPMSMPHLIYHQQVFRVTHSRNIDLKTLHPLSLLLQPMEPTTLHKHKHFFAGYEEVSGASSKELWYRYNR